MANGFNWLGKIIREALAGGSYGDVMTGHRALTLASVKFCVDKISNHVGMLPLNTHKVTRNRNEKDLKHSTYKMLRIRPNGYQTPFQFKRLLQTHALLWGNGRAYIDRQRGELIPIAPDRCETRLIQGEKVHFYKPIRDERLSLSVDIDRALRESRQDPEATEHSVIAMLDREVIHISGIGTDGVQGLSMIGLARQSFNTGLGYEETERNRQKKGYSGGLMLEAPEGAFHREDEAREFLASFRENHSGTKGDVIGMLRGGVKANVMAMSAVDSQFLESRKFNREDIMLWFGMPTMPGDDESVSYNSLEQKQLSYRIDCLGPWLTAWEEECEAKLLTAAEIRNGYYMKHNDGAILRSDKNTTADFVGKLISSRVMNPNEAREMFDLNPYEGGDEFENPAISPGKPSESDDSGQHDATESVVEDMLRVEARRVTDCCKAVNFVDKVERFYSKWEERLNKKLNKFGIEPETIKNHCEESKEQVLACADRATDKEALSTLVSELVENWPNKAEEIAGALPC